MAPARVGQDDVFDYIVCGGGTSGSVIAGRLAEDINATVLVIEAGPHNENLENTHMAGGWSQNFDKETDWNIATQPTAGINNRQIKVSRGKFLGGSSGCNGTLCIRGTKQDYDDWDVPGWSGEEVFAAMSKAEHFHGKDWFQADEKSHGYSGLLHTEPHDLAPISQLIMKSYESLGMPYDADMFTTGATSHGCGHAPRTVYQGIRTTGADFITKDNVRNNVTIKCDTTVDKVVLEGHGDNLRATGVKLVNTATGEETIAHARREVIVSGGSYCSPTILMRSGVGPAAHLTEHQIPVLVNLPGVGQNLQDHLIVFVFYETEKAGLTTDHLVYHGPDSFLESYNLWKEKKEGFLASFPFGAFAYARLDDRLADSPLWTGAPRNSGRDPMGLSSAQPNIEFFHTECYGGPKQFDQFPVQGQHCFSMITELFSPQSRGSVTLASADPHAAPVVDHAYLSHPLDVLVLTEGVRLGNEVVMAGEGTRDIVKGAYPAGLEHHVYASREQWEAYVRENATTCYHPGGTCKMGKPEDALGVVDERLRVRGVKGLRVADVSIMPKLNMGHTQMPAYAIGERAAEMIKEDALKAGMARVDSHQQA